MKIQLLFFEGCPNLEPARAALSQALAAEGVDARVEEIDIEAPAAPEWARASGSPTILVDGEDVAGAVAPSGAACRLYPAGAPTVEEIRARIAEARRARATSGRVAVP